MSKKGVNNVVKQTASVTGKVVRVSLGLGLLLLNVATTVVGAIVCAVTSQN